MTKHSCPVRSHFGARRVVQQNYFLQPFVPMWKTNAALPSPVQAALPSASDIADIDGRRGTEDEAVKLAAPEEVQLIKFTDDSYGGVIASVAESAMEASAQRFAGELSNHMAKWQTDGKQGIWMKVPLQCAVCVVPVAAAGFVYHHAIGMYAMLVKWLPATPCPLPLYAFTRIGVGGVVVNSKDEVLLVKERNSPQPKLQDSWKMPGGLANMEEDFYHTVVREVREETAVEASPEGILCLRHAHDYPFRQSDIYVIVKLRAVKGKEDICIDDSEILDAKWFSKEQIEAMKVSHGQPMKDKISPNNFTMAMNAFSANLITAEELPNPSGQGKPTLLYTCRAQPAHTAKDGPDPAAAVTARCPNGMRKLDASKLHCCWEPIVALLGLLRFRE